MAGETQFQVEKLEMPRSSVLSLVVKMPFTFLTCKTEMKKSIYFKGMF